MISPHPLWVRRACFWMSIATLALAVWVVFRTAGSAGFLQWDDNRVIQENVHLRGLTGENVRWMFSDLSYEPRYQPLAWLDWALDYQLFGLTARSCHLGNILLHLANAVLVFLFLRRLLQVAQPQAIEPWITMASALAALIWALHPLRVEPVAWATGRRYLQATLFLLLSILAYLGRVKQQEGGRRRWLLWGSVAAFTASILTYPPVISYLGALIVLDLYLRGRVLWREKLPFAVVTGLVVGATLWARYHTTAVWDAPLTLHQFGSGARLSQAFYVWAYYAWKPLLPFHLAPVYTALVDFKAGDGKFLASALGVVAVTGWLLWQRRRWPGAWAIWMCHLLLLVPVLGLTEHPHYTNDRYIYVAAIAWTAGLAGLLCLALTHRSWRWGTAAAAFAIALACGKLSASQIGIWQSNETFFRYQLAELGANRYRWDILSRLGEDLRRHQRPAEAAPLLRESLRVYPSANAEISLGLILQDERRDDEAIACFESALRLEPANPTALSNLGSALGRVGRFGEAIVQFRRALSYAPDAPEIHNNLGTALLATRAFSEAAEQFQRALALNPHLPGAESNLGEAENDLGAGLASRGHWAEALPHFQRAVALRPNDALAHENLGRLLILLGQKDAGLAERQEAARLKAQHSN